MANARARSVRSRRPTFWISATESAAVVQSAGSLRVTTLVSEATLEESPNPTLVRMRGNFYVHVGGAGAAGAAVRWGAGIYLATARALAAGTTAILRPISDGNSDEWIWWQTGLVAESAVDNVDSVQQSQQIVIDNKAMRKVGQNVVLVLAVENISGASQSLDTSLGVRILFKR